MRLVRCARRIPDLAPLGGQNASAFSGTVCMALDILITVSLCYDLNMRRTGFSRYVALATQHDMGMHADRIAQDGQHRDAPGLLHHEPRDPAVVSVALSQRGPGAVGLSDVWRTASSRRSCLRP